MRSKSAQLTEKYGGTWTYDGQFTWFEEGSYRKVVRIKDCNHDYDCKCSKQYYLYDGPTRVGRVRFDRKTVTCPYCNSTFHPTGV